MDGPARPCTWRASVEGRRDRPRHGRVPPRGPRVAHPAVGHALDHRYEDAPAVSIDYGIMEKAGDLWAVPGEFGWSDVGSWADLASIHPTSPGEEIRIGGPQVLVEARGNVVVGDKLVALVGVEGLVVVATDDAVLIMPRERSQDVRRVVAELERQGLDAYL